MGNMGRNELCSCGSGKKFKNCCINKLSKEDIYLMYRKQLKLANHLTNKENCMEVLRLGRTIIDNDANYIWATGTYVNMSLAKRVLYYLENSLEDLNEARIFCEKAIELKPNNQSALKTLFEISIELEYFDEAISALKGYEIDNIFDPMTIQIIEKYQRTIHLANRKKDNERYKEFLQKVTDILFEKYGMNPGLCAVSTEYYISIGNDIIKAYENAKRCVESYPNAEIYNTLGLICINPQMERIEEAKEFFNKALELANDEEMVINVKSNCFIILIKENKFDEAEMLALELLKERPCNQNFSNYAELLKRRGKFEEAINWAKKALFIIEDDTTLLILADIYIRSEMYEEAINIYKKCIQMISDNGSSYSFNDFDGSQLYSVASNKDLNEVFRGLISSYNKQGDYKNAKAYLRLAKEQIPENSEWNVWEETLPKIENVNEEYRKAKELLENSLTQNNVQKEAFREWALKLIRLQDNSQELDLDLDDDWEKYESKMNSILNDMVRIIDKESQAYISSKMMVNSKYNNLNNDAKEFLISAEVLYEVHKNSIIDFAPIVVEYCKVVEKQLRILLANELTEDQRMLGQVIGKIDKDRIMPYFNYLHYLRKVNILRRESAHTGVLTKKEVDEIREIFYTNNLLAKLV